MAFPIEEHGEKYAVSPVAFEKSVDSEASACESAGKPLTGIFSNDLHTKHLQHDSDVLTKETGEGNIALILVPQLVTDLGDDDEKLCRLHCVSFTNLKHTEFIYVKLRVLVFLIIFNRLSVSSICNS